MSVEDLGPEPNTRIGPKDFFEMASKNHDPSQLDDTHMPTIETESYHCIIKLEPSDFCKDREN